MFKSISKIIENNYRLCLYVDPSMDRCDLFFFKNVNDYNSGTGFLLDNASIGNLGRQGLNYLYWASGNNVYCEGETYRNETSSINMAGVEKLKILEIYDKDFSTSGTVSEFDMRPIDASIIYKKQLVISAFHEARYALTSNAPFIFIMHKNQIENLIKIGISNFKKYFLNKIKNHEKI